MLKKGSTLKEDYFNMLYTLFEEKKWNNNPYRDFVFDNFIERLRRLENENDIEFILDLTKQYLWVDSSQYSKILFDAFIKWRLDHKDCHKILFAPVIKKCEGGIEKSARSSMFVIYLLYESVIAQMRKEKNKVIVCSDYEEVAKKCDKKKNVVLVDDFIGSGESAITAIHYLNSHLKDEKKPKDITVLALVTQNGGAETVQKEGYKVYTSINRNKAISDNYPNDIVEEKIAQMKRISSRYTKNESFYLGFADSEALVTMNRTPNNTFPFYWRNAKNNIAPFSRVE